MAHLADEDCHAWALVAVVEAELHLVALRIERVDVVVELVARNQEPFQFPFYAHEEHPFYLIDVLVQIDDVAFVVGDKLRHLRDDALLVGAMQEEDGCGIWRAHDGDVLLVILLFVSQIVCKSSSISSNRQEKSCCLVRYFCIFVHLFSATGTTGPCFFSRKGT